MTQPDLNPCNGPGQDFNLNQDPPPEYCGDDTSEPSNKRVRTRPDQSWDEEFSFSKTGAGQSGNADPMQQGYISNNQGPEKYNNSTIYRYSRSLRGCDEAMVDLFSDIVVRDEQLKDWPVPIIWATQEKAVAAILQTNVRQDNTLVVDRIRLPMLAINDTGMEFDQSRWIYHQAKDYLRYLNEDKTPGFTTKEKYERDTVFGVTRGLPVTRSYTLYGWVGYEEDKNQIIEQIYLKFSPKAYLKIRGVFWETQVELTSYGSNTNIDPGDNAFRIIKFQFNFNAKTYIPQPITRKKAVLKTKVTLTDFLEQDEVTDVISRLEEAVKDLEEC